MMSSITPVGEVARGQRWWLTTVAYLVGSTLGGLAVGSLLGLLSVPVRAVLSPAVALLVLVVVAVLGLLADRGVVPLPTLRRQVDERWLTTYRGWVYGSGFGLQLGAGVTTIITASITLVTLATALLSGSVAAGALIGTVFGFVRALPVLALRGATTTPRLHRTFQRVEAMRGPAATFATAVQTGVAVAALAVATSRLLPGGGA